MGFVRDWICAAANELHQQLRELAASETQDLIFRIRSQFCNSSTNRGPIWHDLKLHFGERWSDGWREVGKYVDDSPCVLVEQTEPCAFRFANGIELTRLLGETPGFEFYVVDDSLSYLICQNDHDYLIAAGDAESWVRSAYEILSPEERRTL